MEYKFQIIEITKSCFKGNHWYGNEVNHFDVAFSCTVTPETTNQEVAFTYLYMSLCLDIVNLVIFAYVTYHIRLMNVSKVTLLNYRSVNTQKQCRLYILSTEH